MKNVSDIIEAFGGVKAFAGFFEVSRHTVNTWKRRNFFPPERDLALVTEADRRKIDLTFEHLAKMRAG